MELVTESVLEETEEKNGHPVITFVLATLGGATVTWLIESGLNRWFTRDKDSDDTAIEDTTEQE